MPNGVETFVDGNGFAVVDFVDPSLRGPALARLIEIGGPESVETITRDGPRRKYRVPEGNANEAGLVDNAVDATASGDVGYAAALEQSDPIARGGEFRPDVRTVRGANDAGPVDQTAVLGGQSVSTTESQTAAPAAGAEAPPHAEVIDHVAKTATAARKATRKRAAELADQRPPQTSSAVLNASLASQTGALATDPQSRGGEGIVPAAQEPAAEPETPAPADGPVAASPSAPAPLDPSKDITAGEQTPTEPSLDSTRAEIDSHAADVHGIDTTAEPNKQAALAKIQEAKS